MLRTQLSVLWTQVKATAKIAKDELPGAILSGTSKVCEKIEQGAKIVQGKLKGEHDEVL